MSLASPDEANQPPAERLECRHCTYTHSKHIGRPDARSSSEKSRLARVQALELCDAAAAGTRPTMMDDRRRGTVHGSPARCAHTRAPVTLPGSHDTPRV